MTLPVPDASGPGIWTPPQGTTSIAAPFPPHLPAFTLTDLDGFRPGPPPGLTSGQYATEYAEVAERGALHSLTRTDEQTTVANFWQSPAVLGPSWHGVARQAVAALGCDPWESARLFAAIALAQNDSTRVMLDAKYVYLRWRPQQAIREGDADVSSATAGDADWTAQDQGPAAFANPAGHASNCSAAGAVLATLLGTDSLNFGISRTAETRQYSSFSEAANECAESRIYGGSHTRSALDAGAAIGQLVADHVVTHFLLPAR